MVPVERIRIEIVRVDGMVEMCEVVSTESALAVGGLTLSWPDEADEVVVFGLAESLRRRSDLRRPQVVLTAIGGTVTVDAPRPVIH
jgi:hypothetical protein